MKPQARVNFINALNKENLDIDLNLLSNKELKTLFCELQKAKQFPYKMIKNMDFKEVLQKGKLQYGSFRNTPNVRNLSLKEYLPFKDFCEKIKGFIQKGFLNLKEKINRLKMCENCRERTENTLISIDTETIVKNTPIAYTGIQVVCSNCGEIKYDADTNDKDVKNIKNAYFNKGNLQ